ncbi:conserved hypothetical protein [Vibrio phage 199E37-1]|nr:conserved hypothetical protein [Vibrio phage 199E37-1]
MERPKDYKPVLAKIEKQGSLGLSTWHEVVFFCEDRYNAWQPYSGSDTFSDGEKVLAWSYVDEIELCNK